jgi:phage baseplate assembly protein W
MSGFGLDALGAYPMGFALPETASDPPDPPDQARYIDFLTKNYVVRADGELERMPITRQRVWLTLSTDLGSSTVLRDFGVKLPGIINERYELEVRTETRRALKYLTDEEAIRLLGVTVDSSSVVGRSKNTVEYEDTATLESDKVEI